MGRRQLRQAMGCRDDVPSREKGRRAERSSPSFRFSLEGVAEPALNDKAASALTHGNDGTCRRLSVKRRWRVLMAKCIIIGRFRVSRG